MNIKQVLQLIAYRCGMRLGDKTNTLHIAVTVRPTITVSLLLLAPLKSGPHGAIEIRLSLSLVTTTTTTTTTVIIAIT